MKRDHKRDHIWPAPGVVTVTWRPSQKPPVFPPLKYPVYDDL